MNRSITQLMKSLKNETIEPVYLLQGNDKYLQRFLADKIAEIFFDNSKKDKTLLIPSADMKDAEIIEQITTTDLFNSKKIFILLDPQKISGKSRNELLSYCDNPLQSNCLIIILEEFGKSVAMVRELTKRFEAINVSSPFEADMKKWTKYFLRNKGIEAKSTVIDKIFDIAGDSVAHIANEIDKISILLDDGQELTEELVMRFSGWQREHQRWEFFKALGNKSIGNSLKMGLSLINQNETFVTLIYPLTAFFQEILFTKLSKDIIPGRNGYVPLSNSIVKNLPNFAKKYSKSEVKLAINLLADIELRQKTTVVSDESEMTKFLFTLLKNK